MLDQSGPPHTILKSDKTTKPENEKLNKSKMSESEDDEEPDLPAASPGPKKYMQ